jgi:hypothetical protein
MDSLPQQSQPSAAEDVVAVHPGIEGISYLLGTWKGQGEGGFPTINSFSYGEELCFSHHSSKPVIAYTQKTWKLASGEPMHAESGYWRPRPDGSIEVVIAQSTGLVEVLVPFTHCHSFITFYACPSIPFKLLIGVTPSQ